MPQDGTRLELTRPKRGSAHDTPCHASCLLHSPAAHLTCGAYALRRAGDRAPSRHARCRQDRDDDDNGDSSTDSPSPTSLPLGAPVGGSPAAQPQGMWHGEPDDSQPPPAGDGLAAPRPVLLEEAVASRNGNRHRGHGRSSRHATDWADGAQHPVPLGEAVAARRRRRDEDRGRPKSRKRGAKKTLLLKCCCFF